LPRTSRLSWPQRRKVVFFAKHVDLMDAAEETFARQGVRFSSIRGGQTPLRGSERRRLRE